MKRHLYALVVAGNVIAMDYPPETPMLNLLELEASQTHTISDSYASLEEAYQHHPIECMCKEHIEVSALRLDIVEKQLAAFAFWRRQPGNSSKGSKDTIRIFKNEKIFEQYRAAQHLIEKIERISKIIEDNKLKESGCFENAFVSKNRKEDGSASGSDTSSRKLTLTRSTSQSKIEKVRREL